ncbi:hypothetical protein BOX15_Mlig031679g3 [Macrostomum lignano]|uniref:Uncharacterized protein n=1 Tax=Macrostomum lignano TaxID=282301 RepID=A0A267DL89_9PLAT|nr:hypothetical protein BOX15_Mlig031679g4 [Macrostomum lignano]PAA51872.1 hypothetical protein BOX15_Mlig031679g3 [Macrostomum lignano]
MAGPLTPSLFMESGSYNSKVMVRYRLVENNLKLMSEIGADNVQVTSVGSANDELMDFRIQVSMYDQVFVRAAFDLVERGAVIMLEVLVMRAVGKSRTIVTRMCGICSQSQATGRSSTFNPPMELTARLKKHNEEDLNVNLSEAFRLHKGSIN